MEFPELVFVFLCSSEKKKRYFSIFKLHALGIKHFKKTITFSQYLLRYCQASGCETYRHCVLHVILRQSQNVGLTMPPL